MSNVVSIRGYQIQQKLGRPMIKDLDLATRLEYDKPHNIRRLISRMIENGQIKPEQVFSAVEKTPQGGRPGTAFYLDQKASIKVITKSETKKADEITDEVIDVFLAFQNGETAPKRKRESDPVITNQRRAIAVLSAHKRAGKMLGTAEPMANVLAVEAVKREVGVDFRPLLASNSVEEVPVTPTDIGIEFGISARRVNQVLADAGLQTKSGDTWVPTEKGKKCGSYEPYKSQNSDHTGYRMMWFRSKIADIVRKGVAA